MAWSSSSSAFGSLSEEGSEDCCASAALWLCRLVSCEDDLRLDWRSGFLQIFSLGSHAPSPYHGQNP